MVETNQIPVHSQISSLVYEGNHLYESKNQKKEKRDNISDKIEKRIVECFLQLTNSSPLYDPERRKNFWAFGPTVYRAERVRRRK